MLALTGPSGSGKSTILNLCGLIDTPDSGDILLGGQPVNGLNEVQRTLLRRDALCFVFQSFNLVPVMTVAENVDYPLFIAGVPLAERRERVAAQLLAVGLQDHAHHRPDALSGGQRQPGAQEPALAARVYRRDGAVDWHGFARAGAHTGASVGFAVAWVASEALELHSSWRRSERVDRQTMNLNANGLPASSPWPVRNDHDVPPTRAVWSRPL